MKQKILLTFIESGFGHISSMNSVYDALREKYSDYYDIEKSYIMREDGYKSLKWMESFITKQVQNTNGIPGFGKFVFPFIKFLGGHKLLRFFHRQMARKSFAEGLQALKNRAPDVIVTNHYFTDLLAVEYKRRINPDVVVVNYNPDNTLHSFWDNRDGVFIVNDEYAYEMALKYKFKRENLRLVTPCVRECVEKCTLSRELLREKHGLPADKFTVVLADGAYMMGRGPRFAKKLIKSGLPITLCIIAGNNIDRYNYFKAVADGKKRLKVKDGMTLKVYPFLDDAYELYGAADLFLTKGGPNAVLDSVYMNTPVMINYCPHVIEESTARVFVKTLGTGETAFTSGRAVKRIRQLMSDNSPLLAYERNIRKLVEKGNGVSATAKIVHEEATAKRDELKKRGVYYDEPIPSISADDAPDIMVAVMADENADTEIAVR